MNYFLKQRTTILAAVILVVAWTAGTMMVGCRGFQFKPGVGLEQKLAIAKEGGWQMGFRYMKWGQKEQWEFFEATKRILITNLARISNDLGDPEKIINAEYLKVEIFNLIDYGLENFGTDIPLEDRRLIQATQNFFYFDCPEGCEATPEQRVLGQAFCDGMIEGITVATAPPA